MGNERTRGKARENKGKWTILGNHWKESARAQHTARHNTKSTQEHIKKCETHSTWLSAQKTDHIDCFKTNHYKNGVQKSCCHENVSFDMKILLKAVFTMIFVKKMLVGFQSAKIAWKFTQKSPQNPSKITPKPAPRASRSIKNHLKMLMSIRCQLDVD